MKKVICLLIFSSICFSATPKQVSKCLVDGPDHGVVLSDGRKVEVFFLYSISTDLTVDDVLKEMEKRNLRPATVEEAKAVDAFRYFPPLPKKWGQPTVLGFPGVYALGSIQTNQDGSRSCPRFHIAEVGGMGTRLVDFHPCDSKFVSAGAGGESFPAVKK